jgi:HTH-type transcriptional regulator/antitoxin HigA
MTYNPKKYSALLSAALPGVIDSLAEYNRVEEIFNGLFKDNRSPEEDRLFDLLANLLEDYEKRTLPPLEKSSPLDTVKFLMQENKTKQKDLLPVFNSEGVVSDILSGRRPITLKTARKLAEFFNVPAELFI